MNNYVALKGGGKFFFLDPQENSFTIEVIAHALAMTCRYAGHSKLFYSVAEHATAMCRYLRFRRTDLEICRQALIHDAAEAFLPDLAAPIKHVLPEYAALEKKIEAVVFPKYGVPITLDPVVKDIDIRICIDEGRDLMDIDVFKDWGWDKKWTALGLNFTSPNPPEIAKMNFIEEFKIVFDEKYWDAEI